MNRLVCHAHIVPVQMVSAEESALKAPGSTEPDSLSYTLGQSVILDAQQVREVSMHLHISQSKTL